MFPRRFLMETERLRIRDHVRGDFDHYYELFADPVVTEFTYDGLRTDRRAQLRLFREILAQAAQPERDKYYLLVEDRMSGSFIGECGFDVRLKEAHGGIAEAGYFLAREKWGSGYATEILRALIDYCFGELGLHKVIATCDIRNERSAHVIEKCGMEREGLLRRQRMSRGVWVDECFYGVLNKNFSVSSATFPTLAPLNK
jgi:[ribosomal protein S5]-alanine N-acetyltransferase